MQFTDRDVTVSIVGEEVIVRNNEGVLQRKCYRTRDLALAGFLRTVACEIACYASVPHEFENRFG